MPKVSKPAPATLVKKSTSSIIKPDLDRPSWLGPRENASGLGFEEVDRDDLLIPRFALCQQMTPHRQKSDPKYIKGLEEGMFFNSISSTIYGEGPILFTPLFMFKNSLKTDDDGNIICRSDDGRNCSLGKPCECREWVEGEPPACTLFTNFTLLLHDDPRSPIVLSFKRATMKHAKQWITFMKMLGGNMFERTYKISSMTEQNGAGQTYYVPKIEHVGFVSEEIHSFASAMFTGLRSKTIKVHTDGLDEEGEDDEL